MKKINMKHIWSLCGQVIFAIFIIIALYALGTKASHVHGVGAVPTDFKHLDGEAGSIYGLDIAGIVIAFAAIIMPLISLFYKNGKADMIMGWTTEFLDVVAFTLILAAISVATKEFSHSDGYNMGYNAGAFLFLFFGAGLGFAGVSIAYKENLMKLA